MPAPQPQSALTLNPPPVLETHPSLPGGVTAVSVPFTETDDALSVMDGERGTGGHQRFSRSGRVSYRRGEVERCSHIREREFCGSLSLSSLSSVLYLSHLSRPPSLALLCLCVCLSVSVLQLWFKSLSEGPVHNQGSGQPGYEVKK